MASVSLALAKSPQRGPVRIAKPELADAMPERIFAKIRDTAGGHDEVAVRRPIVRWVLDVPFAAYGS
jgi:hypothetical protein